MARKLKTYQRRSPAMRSCVDEALTVARYRIDHTEICPTACGAYVVIARHITHSSSYGEPAGEVVPRGGAKLVARDLHSVIMLTIFLVIGSTMRS